MINLRDGKKHLFTIREIDSPKWIFTTIEYNPGDDLFVVCPPISSQDANSNSLMKREEVYNLLWSGPFGYVGTICVPSPNYEDKLVDCRFNLEIKL